MRFLLRPGWLALIAVVVGFVIACYTVLAPWQFGRESQREAEQQAIDSAAATPPVPLGDLVAPGAGVRAAVQWRQVAVTGTYLPEAQGAVRLRFVEGKPAVEVLTPLRTDDGRLLLVARGSVPAASGGALPRIAAPPAGPVELVGRLRTDETDPQARPAGVDGANRTLYVADSATLAAATGLALEPGWLQLGPDQPGVLTPLAVEPRAAGGAPFTNLSYALQWLTFGAIAVFALVFFVRLELLQRRRRTGRPVARTTRRAELRRALAGDDPAPAGRDGADTPTTAPHDRSLR